MNSETINPTAIEKEYLLGLVKCQKAGQLVVLQNVLEHMPSVKILARGFISMEDPDGPKLYLPKDEIAPAIPLEDFDRIESNVFHAILTIISTTEELERKKYIVLSKLPTPIINGEFLGDRRDDQEYEPLSIIPNEVQESLICIFHSRIFLAPALFEFVKNGCLTQEQKQFAIQISLHEKQVERLREQLTWTKGALLLSLVGLVTSVITAIWLSNSSTDISPASGAVFKVQVSEAESSSRENNRRRDYFER